MSDLKTSEYDFTKIPYSNLVRVGPRHIYSIVAASITASCHREHVDTDKKAEFIYKEVE